MEIFNVGILEFLFILLLAFIILGPKKAVELAGEVGRWVKDFVKSPFWREIVNTSRDIKDIPRKLMDDAEVQRTIDEINRTTTEVRQQLNQDTIGTILPPPAGENPDKTDSGEPDKP